MLLGVLGHQRLRYLRDQSQIIQADFEWQHRELTGRKHVVEMSSKSQLHGFISANSESSGKK